MFFFGKATTSVLQVDFFFRVGQISFNLTCTFGVHHGKSFVPTLFFLLSLLITYFITLILEKRKNCFGKSLEKILNLGS